MKSYHYALAKYHAILCICCLYTFHMKVSSCLLSWSLNQTVTCSQQCKCHHFQIFISAAKTISWRQTGRQAQTVSPIALTCRVKCSAKWHGTVGSCYTWLFNFVPLTSHFSFLFFLCKWPASGPACVQQSSVELCDDVDDCWLPSVDPRESLSVSLHFDANRTHNHIRSISLW